MSPASPYAVSTSAGSAQAGSEREIDDFDRLMTGIAVNRSEAFLGELPGAYNDIDLVMEQSKDLVEVIHTFRQIVSVKGA